MRRSHTVRTAGAGVNDSDNSLTSDAPAVQVAVSDRAALLSELFTPSLSDADVTRIAEAVAVVIAERCNVDDIPEMVRPMSQDEAAAWLGVHPSTLSLMTSSGEVPAFRLGSKPRYCKADLARWLRRQPYVQDTEAA